MSEKKFTFQSMGYNPIPTWLTIMLAGIPVIIWLRNKIFFYGQMGGTITIDSENQEIIRNHLKVKFSEISKFGTIRVPRAGIRNYIDFNQENKEKVLRIFLRHNQIESFDLKLYEVMKNAGYQISFRKMGLFDMERENIIESNKSDNT